MKKPEDMTIEELRTYVNTLSNEEFEKFEQEFDVYNYDIDLDVTLLLKANRLYDYMNYKKKGDIQIEL